MYDIGHAIGNNPVNPCDGDYIINANGMKYEQTIAKMIKTNEERDDR